MQTYQEMFDCPVGFSDHTDDIFAPLGAVARGAAVIEKHFTLSRNLSTPDASIAIEPDAFERMVEGIRAVEKTLTPAVRTDIESEEENFKESVRYRLVLDVAKSTGDEFNPEDFRFLRHDQGVDCRDVERVVDRMQANKSLSKGDLLRWSHLEGKQ
jgi:sialic acid synthase SpsE